MGGDYYYEGKATKESEIIKIMVIILNEKALNNFDYSGLRWIIKIIQRFFFQYYNNNFDYYTFFVDFHVMHIFLWRGGERGVQISIF